MSVGWTEDRVELLKKLWAHGLSCSQIAGRLGYVSRNAVIGKVTRLGLPGRATTVRQKVRRAPNAFGGALNGKRSARAAPRPPGNPVVRAVFAATGPVDVTPEESVIPLTERKTVATIGANDCRWPIGDPQRSDFHFCGKGAVPGIPYCEHHARKAFQPPTVRRAPTLRTDTTHATESETA